jgi:hypothetical protein
MASLTPFLVFILCLWFAYLLSKQYFSSRKTSQFFWFVSLIFSALASISYCICLWTTPHNAVAFALYYVFGAMWMPAIMGLGSCALVLSDRALVILTAMVAATGLVGTILLFRAPLSYDALMHLDGGAGVGIMQEGVWLVPLICLSSFGAFAVIAVACLSAWKTYRRNAPRRFLYGNLWLTVGILVISSAGSAARLGWPQLFWITMLFGWILTFVGYRMLTPLAQRRAMSHAMGEA